MEKPPSLIGRVFGGYRLVTQLRSGGMGTVYYAEHPVIGRRAAVKILRPEVAQNPQVVARFLTEARAVNDIRHPNVVEITDIGVSEGLHYIVMSFLEGETLGERLERDRVLDEASAIRIVRQVASALGAAHERGNVHYPDYVKVLDFGIAKLIGDQASPESHLTEGGTVVGTPAYMSPEQCRARGELDHRSDIYSLGVMLYQMLVGQVPFRALSITDVLIAHVQEKPVPPIEINPKLSIHLNAAILRALEKDPGRRFSSMRELRDAIERAPNAIPPGLTEETFAKREQREASFVVDKLTQIILQRLERDSLLIPSMPAIAIQCIGLLDDPNQTFSDVGKLVGRDPVLASRVLRMANSAAFPGKVAVATLEQAIVRMGTEGLKLALVNYSMYQAFSSKNERIRSSFRGIWEHSLAVALVAKELAERLTGSQLPDPAGVYLAGLLHDVGKPVVGALLLEAERLISDKQSELPWISHSVWTRVVNGSHRRVGTALARKWNLPAQISSAIEGASSYDPSVPVSFANLVCLANAFAKQEGLYAGDVDLAQIDDLVAKGKRLLGLSDEVMADLRTGLYQRVGTLLELKPPAIKPPAS